MGKKKQDNSHLDELDDILNAIDDDQHGDVAALDELFEAPVLLPGELQGTDEEVMAFKFEDLADEDFNPEDFEEDEFEGDPLLIAADGQPLTDDQLKLLYCISRYSHKARSPEENEKWIRKVQLLVLIYEGVVAKAFNYDYAPQVQQIEHRYVYMNISQEGKDDIDDLREAYLIAAARVTSKQGQSITAYQLTEKGYDALARVPEDLCKEIDDFIDQQGSGALIEAVWDPMAICFRMRIEGTRNIEGRVSTVTDCEDVSYVSSPYIPEVLRVRGRECMSNASRAHESAMGGTDALDVFDEAVFLDGCTLAIMEWIPYGMNQLMMLNDKLGSTERVQGGLFTAEQDSGGGDTEVSVGTGLTNIVILDYEEPAFVSIEAEILYPEEDSIVQVECFGIYVRMDGTLIYGLHMEAIADRVYDNMSLDNLARVIVDVQQDSSRIVDSILSAYQRVLLDMVFLGDYSNRPKVNILLAERIRPWLPAEKYMDKEACENELKQVVGDTDSAHQLDENQVLVVGKIGLLIAGEGAKSHEELFVAYASLGSRDLYLRTFFTRCIIMEDQMRRVRLDINTHEQDPGSIHRIRDAIAKISKDALLLNETLLYMHESMQDMEECEEPPQEQEAAYNLHYLLNIGGLLTDLKARARDVQKNVDGIHFELKGLRDITAVISEKQMFQLQDSMALNTTTLEQVFRATERTSGSLEIMQVVLAGGMCFQFMDRITGAWSVLQTEWGETYIKEAFVDSMGLWFLISMGLWLVIAVTVVTLIRFIKRQSIGVIQFKSKIDEPLNMKAFEAFLAKRHLLDEDLDLYTGGQSSKEKHWKITWVEPTAWRWMGAAPTVEMTVDKTNKYVVKYNLRYNKNHGALDAHSLNDEYMLLLREEGVIPMIPVPRRPRPAAEIEVKFEKTEEVEIDMDTPLKSLAFIEREKTDEEVDPFLASMKGTNSLENALNEDQ